MTSDSSLGPDAEWYVTSAIFPMKKLIILLGVVLAILVAMLVTRYLAGSSAPSFDQVLESLQEVSKEVPAAGSHSGLGTVGQKETLVDLLNPLRKRTPNRLWTSEIESHRTGLPIAVFMEGRGNRIWRIVIQPDGDPGLANEIETFLLNRHPGLRPLLSFSPGSKP